jgi:hypothetical protein
MKDIKIESLDHLRTICSGENAIECYILIGGFIRSSKVVLFTDPGWWVLHEIDDSEVDYEDDEHLMDTHIGDAIDKGAMYAYVFEHMTKEDVNNLMATRPEPKPVEQMRE